MTATEQREKVCAQARAWLGKNEADGSFRAIIDIYNAGRPPGAYRMTYQDPWCAAFVSAVGMAAGLGDVLLPEVSCDRMIAAYRAAGRWAEADDYPAKPGDLIFYDWEDSGVGDNHGSSDHVGIIVADNDYYFTVIEGNKSDAVGTRTLAHNSRFIRGFAVPGYEGAKGEAGETDSHGADAPRNDGEGVDNANSALGDPFPKGTSPSDVATPADASTQDDTSANSAFRIPNSALVTLPVLREGDESEAVRNAQRLLIARGYYCGGYMSYNGREKPDGEFGAKTSEAVKLFQASEELTADGVIGAQTWTKLLGVTA